MSVENFAEIKGKLGFRFMRLPRSETGASITNPCRRWSMLFLNRVFLTLTRVSLSGFGRIAERDGG
jgi:hypothetical protein